MPVRLAESLRQRTKRLIQLVQLILGERTRLAFETRGNFNP